MRHGITILPELPWRDARPRWQRAEELGFDHAWTYDHLVWGGLPESRWFPAVPTLTAAALATTRIGIGMFVASPNFRHPAPFARDLQALADISDDRLLVGLGVGGDLDSGILGQSALTLRARVDRFVEFVGLLDRVTENDHVTVDGTYFSTVDMRLRQSPIRARNPFLLAGNGPRSIRFAARAGDGWMTTGPKVESLERWFVAVESGMRTLHDELAVHGRDVASFRTCLSLDSSPQFSLASIGVFDDMVGRAGEIGFTDVISHWPRPDAPYAGSSATMESIAAQRFYRPVDPPS